MWETATTWTRSMAAEGPRRRCHRATGAGAVTPCSVSSCASPPEQENKKNKKKNQNLGKHTEAVGSLDRKCNTPGQAPRSTLSI